MTGDVADSCTFEGTSPSLPPRSTHRAARVRATRLARDSRRCRRRSSRAPAPAAPSARGGVASPAKRRLRGVALPSIVSPAGMRARAIATTPRAMAADAAGGTSALDLLIGTGVLFAVGSAGAPPSPSSVSPTRARHPQPHPHPHRAHPRPVPLPRHPRAPRAHVRPRRDRRRAIRP